MLKEGSEPRALQRYHHHQAGSARLLITGATYSYPGFGNITVGGDVSICKCLSVYLFLVVALNSRNTFHPPNRHNMLHNM